MLAFDRDCSEAFGNMRGRLQDQFKKTEDYERKVEERSDAFERKVYDVELVRLERERDQMEKEMT